MGHSLLRSTTTVSSMTFISRVLGFVRDMLAAQFFGAGASVDAFYIAFKIPNFMRNLFAEGSFSQAFVPVLSEYRQTKSLSETKAFINHMSASLSLILFVITFLGILFSPWVVKIFAPGLDPVRFHDASQMLRMTFPYVLFISLTAFCGSILNSFGIFAIPALTPALLNLVLILTAVFLSPLLHIPVESQAWGVLIAGVVQLVFQLPFLAKQGLLPRPILLWRDPGVRKVLRLMIPAIFGSSVTQISLLLNTVFASFLKVGSVTWLYYSDRLAYFPLGVFGVALATVVLPHLSRKHSENSPENFQKGLDWGLRCNLLIGLPATVTLFVFAGPLISTLFQRGLFKIYDVFMTRESVIAYALGLQAFMLVKLFSTAFYAQQNIRTPVRIAVIAMISNMILNAVLIFPLAHAGLALATSLSAWLNTILLGYFLWKRKIYQFQKGWGRFLLMLFFANLAVFILLWYGAGSLPHWFAMTSLMRTEHLLFWLVAAIFAYTAVLYSFGFRLRFLRGVE